MLLRHCGHSRVVASTGVSVLRRSISQFTGRTTKKKTVSAMTRELRTVFNKSP